MGTEFISFFRAVSTAPPSSSTNDVTSTYTTASAYANHASVLRVNNVMLTAPGAFKVGFDFVVFHLEPRVLFQRSSVTPGAFWSHTILRDMVQHATLAAVPHLLVKVLRSLTGTGRLCVYIDDDTEPGPVSPEVMSQPTVNTNRLCLLTPS